MMESYVESRLNRLNEVGIKSNFKQRVVVFFSSCFVILILPYLHIGVFYHIWAPDKPTVNKGKCVCDCFDTVFRGRYEWPPSAYKHVYFNATSNTLWIWFIIILGVVSLHESLRYLIPLFWNKKLRFSMFVVFITAIYPHYYGWWGLFNYLNEDFYSQWSHQVFFTITEALSTLMVLHLCSLDSRVLPWKLLVILNINLMHIIISSLDQFVNNVIHGQAKGFEAVRDIGLMMPDIFHVLVPFFEMQTMAQKQRCSFFRLFYKEELMLSCICITIFSLLGRLL